MNRLLMLLLCLALIPLSAPPARADDSEIFGANIQPNIMLFIDNSGSMDDAVGGSDYNPNTPYTGSCTGTVVYKGNSCKSVYKNSIDDITDSARHPQADAAKNALRTTGHWNGKLNGNNVDLYLGNYINWLVTPGTQPVKKIIIARTVLTNLINSVEGVRFGLATFTGNSYMGPGGARIVAEIGSSKDTLISSLSSITPNGYTPLGGALRDVGSYYSGTFGYASPIQYSCQPNYVILMTDGLENGTVKLAPQATIQYTTDHATSLNNPDLQNIMLDTIGFALSAADKAAGANDILQTAAKNGGGVFYDTQDQTTLEAALLNAIQHIMQATFCFATPVVPTTSTTGIGRAYLAAFQSDPSRPFWHGFLKAFNRDANGQVKTYTSGLNVGKPNEDADCTVAPDPAHPENTKPCKAWEAGDVLTRKAAGDRVIYTVTSGTTLQSFTTTNSAITRELLNVSTDTDKNKLISFIRGADAYDQNGNGNVTEDRDWKLGDIFHSTPVLITKPFLPSADESYKYFKTVTTAGRTEILLAGANDGMLHAFRESDGVELWAFIPWDLLGSLKELTAAIPDHPFFVDSSPIAADAKIDTGDGQGVAWHTIVVFGERRGGMNYHALDITNTESPVYLWSFPNVVGSSVVDSEIGETWSEPAIGKVKMSDGTQKYVAIFGGGYDTLNNNQHGRGLFVVDVATGSKLWEYKTAASPGTISTSTCSTSDDRTCMNFSLAANPAPLDLNNDGYIDRIYIGDVGGQVWKFDLSKAASLSGSLVTTCASVTSNNCWMGKRLFRAGDPAAYDANPPARGAFHPKQGIYAPINAALDDTSSKNLWIYFGTGDRNHPTNSGTNRFYGIKDNLSMSDAMLTESSMGLADVTSNNRDATQGWFFTLASSEKVLAAADIFSKTVFFTTFTPDPDAFCGGGGAAKLYAVQMATGYAALNWCHDCDDRGKLLTSTDSSQTRFDVIGEGIPSKPVVILTDSGATVTTSVVAATTSQQLPSNPAPPPDFMRRVLYWLERF